MSSILPPETIRGNAKTLLDNWLPSTLSAINALPSITTPENRLITLFAHVNTCYILTLLALERLDPGTAAFQLRQTLETFTSYAASQGGHGTIEPWHQSTFDALHTLMSETYKHLESQPKEDPTDA